MMTSADIIFGLVLFGVLALYAISSIWYGKERRKQQYKVIFQWHNMDEVPEYPCGIIYANGDGFRLYRYDKDGNPSDKSMPYFKDIEDKNGHWAYCGEYQLEHDEQ